MADEKCLHAAWSAQEGGDWECMSCRYRIAYDPRLAVDQVIKVANERDAALLKLDKALEIANVALKVNIVPGSALHYDAIAQIKAVLEMPK